MLAYITLTTYMSNVEIHSVSFAISLSELKGEFTDVTNKEAKVIIDWTII